jgi:hypothetical protein
MSLSINGFAVFGAIAANASVFQAIRADVTKQAGALVTKLLTAKSVDLANLRDAYHALGAESFGLISDGLTDLQIKALLTRIDPHKADIKTEDDAWRRRHLYELVKGHQEAAKESSSKKPTKSAGVKKSSKTKPPSAADEPDLLDYKSAGKRRRR